MSTPIWVQISQKKKKRESQKAIGSEEKKKTQKQKTKDQRKKPAQPSFRRKRSSRFSAKLSSESGCEPMVRKPGKEAYT